ncbi:DNA-directed RNA polymerase subunit M [Pyrodictium occultum]|uniref:DNA-directed RNA polymerase subunit M n=1 Tax=Pyrodictium occultum TaxID=2309 RepID=A0A0V8RUI2_PYROC|nr:transcription factor S [Pyrodictium occultum]KSW11723.1 DNA-directed RNA polymerase subunit M [Pyrodictium occultum]
MKFCPRCGSLMVLRTVDGKRVWVCPSCGYQEEVDGNNSPALSVLRQQIRHSEKERIVVVSSQQNLESLPKTRVTCPRCGYHEAYYWVVQTRRADEPPTRFFKCVSCGYVWREYD